MELDIQQKESESKGKYYIEIEGKRAAEMTYSKSTGRIIIDHTEVKPGFEGKGLGKAMVRQAVADARVGKYKILPLCPFAKRVIMSDASLQDVI